jgi:transcriptional regulator with XRE-family HTH domain
LNSTPENDIAYRLRLWRKDVLEMTQVRFAEATGVHLSAIRKYEGRHSVPSGESLLAIAGTGVDLHWLLTGKGDMRAPSNNGDSDCQDRGGRRTRSPSDGDRGTSEWHPGRQAICRPGRDFFSRSGSETSSRPRVAGRQVGAETGIVLPLSYYFGTGNIHLKNAYSEERRHRTRCQIAPGSQFPRLLK